MTIRKYDVFLVKSNLLIAFVKTKQKKNNYDYTVHALNCKLAELQAQTDKENIKNKDYIVQDLNWQEVASLALY